MDWPAATTTDDPGAVGAGVQFAEVATLNGDEVEALVIVTFAAALAVRVMVPLSVWPVGVEPRSSALPVSRFVVGLPKA